MNSRKKRPAAKLMRKSSPKILVPKNGNEVIVLTGLAHTEAGEQFAFCTAAQNSDGFFLGPEDTASPDGGKDLAARCRHCKTEAGEPETHWIVDFRTALLEERLETEDDGGYILTPLALINLNLEVHGTGPVAKQAAALRAATA
jgi:hypothetical protein